jgi:predicted secreted protein
MAIPNIVNVATIHAVTEVSVLTTTLTTTLVTAAAEYANKINLIRCSNITDNDATVTIDVEKGGTHKMIANEITVPANSSVDIIDKNSSFYLEETDLIRGGASAGSTIDCVISYDKIAD